jgi:hypothetical protein
MSSRVCLRSLLYGVAMMLFALQGHAASTPLPPLPLPDGPVHALYYSDGRLYLAGSFTMVGGLTRSGLAAIDVATGTVDNSWTPDLTDGSGLAATGDVLLPSVDGKTLYVGGEFARVDNIDHDLIAAIDIDPTSTNYGTIASWDPQLSGTAVLALALAPSGSKLYVGGDFTASGNPALPRQNLAAVDTENAATLPWRPDPDGIVHDILPVADGSRVYVAGEFTTIGSSDGRAQRRALAALNPSNAAVQAWDASLTGTSVNRLVLSTDGGYLVIAGLFSQVGSDARVNLARLAVTTAGADSGWLADTDGPVYDLLQTEADTLFVAGDFATIQGAGRQNLAMLRSDSATLQAWDPQIGVSSVSPSVYSLADNTDNARLLVGGDYADIGSDSTYQNLAAYSIEPPVTVSSSSNGFSSPDPLTVTLDCTAQGGSACAYTYYTTDGSEPTAASATYVAPFLFNTTTTLKYFSVDGDGNREMVHSETYVIDVTAPHTTASPAAGTLNAATYVPIELLCSDGVGGSGCATTYYTVDGTAPTTASPVYTTPLDLPDGDTTIRYFSVDQAGNAESEGSVLYTVDRDLPTINVSHDSGNYEPPLDVTLVCDDGAGTGCDQIYLTTDGSNPTDPTDPVTPFTYTGPVTLTLNSASVLRIVVSDVAGNSGSSIVGIYTFTDPNAIHRNGSGAVGAGTLAVLLLLAAVRLRSRVNGGNGACR